MPTPPQPHPWTLLEVQLLKSMRIQGHSNQRIANAVSRTEKAVAAKCRQLKLPPSSYRSPIPTPKQLRKPTRTNKQAKHPTDIPRAGKSTLPPLPSLQND